MHVSPMFETVVTCICGAVYIRDRGAAKERPLYNVGLGSIAEILNARASASERHRASFPFRPRSSSIW